MPKNRPTPQELVDDEVTFFSLDTDLIQAAGYNFEKGALGQLPRQLPRSMKLQLSEVVLTEIVNHLLIPVKQAEQKLQSATAGLTRLTALDFSPAQNHIDKLNVVEAAREKFDTEVRQFVKACRGDILPIEDVSSKDLFELYFSTKPPFGIRADKKSEFPDACALLSLEGFCEEYSTKGILASNDGGWKAYAETSSNVYCVSSIEELAAIFVDSSAHAIALKEEIIKAVNDISSPLREKLSEALCSHIAEADWDASELYSGSHRFEPEITEASLTEYRVNQDTVNAWKVDDEPGAWVVKLTASVKANVDVSIEWFVWDSIDREEIDFGSQGATFPFEVEVEAFLTCHEVKLDADQSSWDIDVEIAKGNYSLDAAEVDLDMSADD